MVGQIKDLTNALLQFINQLYISWFHIYSTLYTNTKTHIHTYRCACVLHIVIFQRTEDKDDNTTKRKKQQGDTHTVYVCVGLSRLNISVSTSK